MLWPRSPACFSSTHPQPEALHDIKVLGRVGPYLVACQALAAQEDEDVDHGDYDEAHGLVGVLAGRGRDGHACMQLFVPGRPASGHPR